MQSLDADASGHWLLVLGRGDDTQGRTVLRDGEEAYRHPVFDGWSRLAW